MPEGQLTSTSSNPSSFIIVFLELQNLLKQFGIRVEVHGAVLSKQPVESTGPMDKRKDPVTHQLSNSRRRAEVSAFLAVQIQRHASSGEQLFVLVAPHRRMAHGAVRCEPTVFWQVLLQMLHGLKTRATGTAVSAEQQVNIQFLSGSLRIVFRFDA